MTLSNDEILRDLATADALPRQALAHALLQVDALAPRFVEILERGARGEVFSPEDQSLFFFGLHVLGAGRHTPAFPPFLRMLAGAGAEGIDNLLGDAVTMTLPRLIAGLYDDESGPLVALIAAPETDPFVRWNAVGALAFLTWEGRVPREETIRLLERFDEERLAEPGDLAWVGWQDAIGLLGLRPLAPRVEGAWSDGRIPAELVDPGQLEAQFAAAEAADPADATRFIAEGLGYLDDLVNDLAWVEEEDDAEGA